MAKNAPKTTKKNKSRKQPESPPLKEPLEEVVDVSNVSQKDQKEKMKRLKRRKEEQKTEDEVNEKVSESEGSETDTTNTPPRQFEGEKKKKPCLDSFFCCLFSPIKEFVACKVICYLFLTFLILALALSIILLSIYLLNSVFATITSPLSLLNPFFYCAYFPSFYGCPPQVDVAKVANALSTQVEKAHTIFDSVVAFTNPRNLGIYQSQIWELAVAAKHSTNLENKDFLAKQLTDLHNLALGVKDNIIDMNSFAINSFDFIVYKYTMIEYLLDAIHSGKKTYPQSDIEKKVDDLFNKIEDDFTQLLAMIENTIPDCSRASRLGELVVGEFTGKKYGLTKLHEEKLLPNWLDFSHDRKQLTRDIEFTKTSIDSLTRATNDLENLRGSLREHRNNVDYLKGNILGQHITDHNLSAEEEIVGLKDVISAFKKSIQRSKVVTSISYQEPEKDDFEGDKGD